SFVRADQLPSGGIGDGWLNVAPDLLVEVLSPSESASDLEEKISDYLTAGTRLIWIVDPDKRRVAIYMSGDPTRWLEDDGVIVWLHVDDPEPSEAAGMRLEFAHFALIVGVHDVIRLRPGTADDDRLFRGGVAPRADEARLIDRVLFADDRRDRGHAAGAERDQ